MKKFALSALPALLFCQLLGPCRPCRQGAVFCPRWDLRPLQAAAAFLQATFFQAAFVNHWRCGKMLKSSVYCSFYLSKKKKKKYNSPTSKPNKQKILHDSWAGPGEASPRPCTSPGWCSAPSTWGGLEGDWGFHGCISYQTCSSTALVVMASISNIFKVIWALPPYDFLALGGKIGRID